MSRFLKTVVLFLLMSGCQSAHFVKKEDFKLLDPKLSLIDAANENIKLSELHAHKKGTVLIFWQPSCPCVKRYDRRIHDLFSRYGDELQFIHVFANTNESFAHVKKEYDDRRIKLPFMHDKNSVLARTLNVKGTPSAVLLDTKGQTLFIGWIDNECDQEEHGRKAYLENAITQFLAHEPISVPSAPMFGCAIR